MARSWIPADHYITYIERRNELCEEMAAQARGYGLVVTAEIVNRNFQSFYRWHTGYWTLGYLIRQTGVQRMDKGAKRS